MTSQVGIYKIDIYSPELIYRKLVSGLADMGIALPAGAHVLLKPNVVSQNTPAQATSTHPAVIDALCRLLTERNCRITIGESSAFYQPGFTARGFKVSGIEAVARRWDAELIAFEEDGVALYHAAGNRVLTEVLLSRRIRDFDYIINVPKLKTHGVATFSGAVKNLYGFVPGGAKYEYHFYKGHTLEIFGHKLCDIWNIIKPDLHIMDGIRALEGQGPSALGKPKKSGLLLLSTAPFALDWCAAGIMGLSPAATPVLKAARERGFLDELPDIKLCGDYAALPCLDFKKPRIGHERPREADGFYRLMLVRPVVRRRKCNHCRLCIRQCSVGALSKTDTIVVDYEKCLNCFHCFYFCPHKAINLKGSFLNGLAQGLRQIIRL